LWHAGERDHSMALANELQQIASRHGTDKAGMVHYLENYEQQFAALRGQDIRLLELGVYKGGSLKMWRDYFPRGLIVGLDMHDVPVEDPSGRIRRYQGLQEDTELLDRIRRETAPDGFDIIIDDCAHIGVLARISFWHLFVNHLKSGGLYVIEDWGTGYWDGWVDGVGYRRAMPGYHRTLHRLSRRIARWQKSAIVRRLPLAAKVLSRAKAQLIGPQYHSHDFGMVGFVKELIDEVGMGDITDPVHGTGAYRPSTFRGMYIGRSHLFVMKA
jgi:hypothetical protein